MFTLLVVSALSIGHIQDAPRNSTMWYDNQIQLTQRVLDGSIEADARRVQYGTVDSVTEPMERKVEGQLKASVKHCRGTVSYLGYKAEECGEVVAR